MTIGPVALPLLVSDAETVPVSGASLIQAPLVFAGSFALVNIPFWPGMPTFVIVRPGAPKANPNCWMPLPVTTLTVVAVPLTVYVHVSPDGATCALPAAAAAATHARIAHRVRITPGKRGRPFSVTPEQFARYASCPPGQLSARLGPGPWRRVPISNT